MKNIHANTVGKIKKDIYIIRNKINNKVYIGQSINSKERFKSHCKPSSVKDGSLIGSAIQAYGAKNFWYEILESQIENYNEREKYWIQYYNSLTPNGYNILESGEEPPIYYGDEHPFVKISDANVKKLKEDLANTALPLSQLAKKYNISKKHVLRINQGESRSQPEETYPIRKKPNINGKLTEEDVDEIIYLLKNTYLFNGEIGKRYGVDSHAISRINNGSSHRRDNIEYPIRKWKSCGVFLFTFDQVTEIIYKLQNTDESISSIARSYGVGFDSIAQINNGSSKKYRRDNLKYPLRPF